MSASGEGPSIDSRPEQRLRDLEIVLPSAPEPLGRYVRAVQVGDLLVLSGALPLRNGVPQFQGRIGDDLTLDQGRMAAREAMLNALAIARAHLGSLDRVTRVARLNVSMVVASGFRDHPAVADAGSEVLGALFGADRAGTRMVLGAHSLPLGVSVVVDLMLAVEIPAHHDVAPSAQAQSATTM